MDKADIEKIEDLIGYEFNKKATLEQAFTRKSYTIDHPKRKSNELLVFVGIKAIEMAIAFNVTEKFSRVNDRGEVESTKTLSELNTVIAYNIKKERFADAVDSFGFIEYVSFGKTDLQEGTFKSVNVKAEIFEAIIGAVAIDSNYNMLAVKKCCEILIEIKYITSDYIGLVKEFCNKTDSEKPQYQVSGMWGNDYEGSAMFDGKVYFGEGDTSHNATVDVAKNIYDGSFEARIKHLVGEPYPLDGEGTESPICQLNELFQKGIVKKLTYSFQKSLDPETNITSWDTTCRTDAFPKGVTSHADSKRKGKAILAYKILRHMMGIEEFTNPDVVQTLDNYQDK